jgi:hypothetical protein
MANGEEQSIRILPSQSREPPGRVDQGVDHGQVQPMPLGDLTPVGDAGAAERVGSDADACLADPVQVQHARQVVDVAAEEVVRRRGGAGPRERDPAYPV